jgi:hypothetical protein
VGLNRDESLHDNLGATDDEVKTSLRDDVALAFKTCNQQRERIAELENELAALKGNSYPHMCRDEHEQIGHSDSENERCPLCRAKDEIAALKRGSTIVITTPLPFLHNDFLTLMNDIGRLGHEQFGTDSFEVNGPQRKIPRHRKGEIIYHARGHLTNYLLGVPHDKLGTLQGHLAAAAFNAMLEFIFSQGE